MQVEVITRHTSRNYGSLLQAIATRELLSDAGFDVRFIDYRHPGDGDSGWSYANRGSARSRNLAFRLGYGAVRDRGTRRIGRMFESTLRRELRLTDHRYRSIAELNSSREFSSESYYCVGSDQVWNIEYNMDNSPYYLEFVPPSAVKFSLASSMGVSRLPREEERRLANALGRFSGVSVREADTAGYLQSIGVSAEQHVDPTLAVTPSFWREFAEPERRNEAYILVYQLNGVERFHRILGAVEAALQLPVKRIEYWRGPRSLGSPSVVLPTLQEFVALFRDAAFVVTDSFHGTAFSMTFGKRFVSVPPPKYDERIRSFLTLADERHRLVTDARVAAEVALVAAASGGESERWLAEERAKVREYLQRVARCGQAADGAV